MSGRRARGLCVTEPYNTHNEMEALQNMIMTGMAAQGHALSPEQVAALQCQYTLSKKHQCRRTWEGRGPVTLHSSFGNWSVK